ncbi:Mth938-like domain-containing protein [Lysobacter cavernae]|uniref:Mth938-like domain-containing protein n=1 Tax=Lysobacter cavernae TaxID=1685901 RepID=A0ABV7RTD7_9GAMM
MLLNLERPDHQFFLRGADGTAALVNERRLEASFIVAPDQVIEGWGVREATALTPQDLEPLLALAPEVILLGTGAAQKFPPATALAACLSRGVGLEAMTNAAAARTFNVLAGEGRHVVAGFILNP